MKHTTQYDIYAYVYFNPLLLSSIPVSMLWVSVSDAAHPALFM